MKKLIACQLCNKNNQSVSKVINQNNNNLDKVTSGLANKT